MNIFEIKKQAEQQIAAVPGMEKNAIITLVMPGNFGSGQKKLAKLKGAPTGKVLHERPTGVLVCFDANEVLAFCDKTIKEALTQA